MTSIDEAKETPPAAVDAGVPEREPTLDDVRGNDGTHRRVAIGCSAVVLLAVAAFWCIRMFVF